MTNKRKTIVILGMHRSITSLVAKGLANEIEMGAVYSPRSDNPYGHWENNKFISLNDAILKRAGGTWCNPPLHEDILKQAPKFNRKIRRLIHSYNKHDIWGWKEPRTTLTIELYLPHLTNPQLVCCFRNPEEVAKSLQVRNGFTMEYGIWLAEIYNKWLLNTITKFTGVK